MISGIVNAEREAVLQVILHDFVGKEQKIEAVVDTGYTGWLTLPPEIVSKLGLAWRERGGATLADGSQALFNVYNATVVWDSNLVIIPVDEIDAEPLIGMSLMYGFELILPILDGATFTLHSITNP